MKKIIIIGFSIGIILLLIRWGAKRITKKIGKDINDFYRPFREQVKREDWSTVDFSSGDYALYINHKTEGQFIVTDPKVLVENQPKINIDRNWVNWLPFEGNRSFGLYLFKNKVLIAEKTGGVFNHFEIDDLASKGSPIEVKRFSGVKQEIKQRLDSLDRRLNVYVLDQPKLPKTDREFSFRVYLPTLVFTKADSIDQYGTKQISTINGVPYDTWIEVEEPRIESDLKNKLRQYIVKKLGDTVNYDLSLVGGLRNDGCLLDANGNYLLDKERHSIEIENLMFYYYEAHIKANQTTANAIKALRFKPFKFLDIRNVPLLLASLRKIKARHQLKVDILDIQLNGYREGVTKSYELYEQEYELRYLEVYE